MNLSIVSGLFFQKNLTKTWKAIKTKNACQFIINAILKVEQAPSLQIFTGLKRFNEEKGIHATRRVREKPCI